MTEKPSATGMKMYRAARQLVHRPFETHVKLHEGERRALLQLCEEDHRAPSDQLRHLLTEECRRRGVRVTDPSNFPDPRLSARVNNGIFQDATNRGGRPRKQPVATVEETEFTVVGDRVEARVKPEG